MDRSGACRRILLTALISSACSAGAPAGGSDDGVPAVSDPTSAAPTIANAVELAPSQLAASTVPAPTAPVPCSVDDLDLWTASIAVSSPHTTAVVRVRNGGDAMCEADISRSPDLDPLIEPDVWLGPGETADLVVESGVECDEPSKAATIAVSVGNQLLDVPTMPSECGWRPAAFSPNDPAGDECERGDLDLVSTVDALLVRNGSAQPCALGGITGVRGAPIATDGKPEISIRELQPGDIVAFGRLERPGCDDASGHVELLDDSVGPLVFDDVPCGLVVDLGGGRPWFGPARSRSDATVDDPIDVDVVVGALNRLDARRSVGT